MILIGIGGNLASNTYGPPRANCGAALEALEARGTRIIARSRWFESAPVPMSDQPWYVNGVVEVETPLGPEDLIGELLAVEALLGRERGELNAARIVDLDLVAYDDRILVGETREAPSVPHPRLAERAFVLLPVADIRPDWRHPATGQGLDEMIAKLPTDQICRPMADADGLYGTEWVG